MIIALAVIVLPMLLSGKPQGDSQQSQKIEIPSRPEGLAFESRRFPVNEQATPPETRQTESDQAPALPQAAETAAEPDPQPDAVTLPSAADPAAAEVAEAAGVSESGTEPPDPGNSQMVTDGVAQVTPLKQPEATTVAAADSSPAAASAAQPADAGGRYVVQVASLGASANARRLMSSLQNKNFPVLMDSVESDVGTLSRVRVGPYATEAEATAASVRIGIAIEGVSPRVVDLQPDQAAAVSTPQDSLVRWVVQAGSFSDASNAERLVANLKEQGLSAYSETITSSASSIFRVRIGPFLERDEAMRIKQQLSEAFSINGVVMSAD